MAIYQVGTVFDGFGDSKGCIPGRKVCDPLNSPFWSHTQTPLIDDFRFLIFDRGRNIEHSTLNIEV
jgi:hypothetical protein